MESKNESQFGYNLIRNNVLRHVLGREHDELLYWTGKSLAREYPLKEKQEIIDFFHQANWGELTVIKEKKAEIQLDLTGDWMNRDDERSYQLEAGFLAEQFELNNQVAAVVTFVLKTKAIRFTVHLDTNDPVSIT